MKAFLLAAGLGTRLRPLTDTTPKCLIPICGKPLMEWWMMLFQRHGITDVLVNTHYLSEQVHDFITSYNDLHRAIHITEYYEAELLGSGGTIAANRSFVARDESFLICYADNLTDIDLTALMRRHDEHSSVLSMALFRTNRPEQCGIAELSNDGRIVGFIEKPVRPKSNLANAGVYVARKELLDRLPTAGVFCDFGKDVLPRLVGNMYGYEIDDYLIDVGTPENLEKARKDWMHDHL